MSTHEFLLRSITMKKSKQYKILLFYTLYVCYGMTMAKDLCGDWEPYKDSSSEKCFKIPDETPRTYDDAEKTCNQLEDSATLVNILSENEQDFLSNILFNTHKVVDNVWIGAKYTFNKFKWIDDLELSFTNWADKNPINQTGNDCVQMIPDVSMIGKWVNVPCGRKNLVVCQKNQILSPSLLQKTLQDTKREFRDLLEDIIRQVNNQQTIINNQQTTINTHQATINNLNQNPVPIGFIYTQLPGQPEPKVLWPNTQWTNVSSEYSGLFFRVVGGDALSFGSVQSENAPRIVKITRQSGSCLGGPNPVLMSPGKSSGTFWISNSEGCDIGSYLIFETSGGEVRPRNKAILIWKRIK